MKFSKPLFFLLLALLVAGPWWIARFIWVMRSQRTQGIYQFAGNGFAGDQVKEDYSVISFKVGEKTIWFNGLGNLRFRPGQSILILYWKDNPYDARVANFEGIWGDTLVYSAIPILILLVMFLHRAVVPWGSVVRLTANRPFLQIISPKPFING